MRGKNADIEDVPSVENSNYRRNSISAHVSGGSTSAMPFTAMQPKIMDSSNETLMKKVREGS